MKITDIADNTIDKDGEIKRRVLINYPQTDGETKAEIRINSFIQKIADEYKKDASGTSLYTYNRLRYRICRLEPLSLFFEDERMGAEGLFSYRPFSVTFSADGYAIPLSLDKTKRRGAKKFFAELGLHIRYRDLRYSYYVTESNQTVIYAAPPPSRRAKRSVIEYRI